MEWICGVCGFIAGMLVMLLTVIVFMGRSERRERKQPSYVCDNCPWDR